MAQQFTTGRDKSTYSGGHAYMTRKINREGISDVWALRDLLWEHRSVPTDERSGFWMGVDSCLMDAITAHPDAAEGAA